MKKQKIPLVMKLGIGLIVVSILLLFALQVRNRMGGEQSRRIAEELQEILPEKTTGVPGDYLTVSMPILEIDGVDYVAVLEVPAFGLTLPVADWWDSSRLYCAPSRFCGSAYDGTLIIGGTDDSRQFGFCGQINCGAQITVTDLTGARFDYTVSCVDRAKHAGSQWLTDGDWDLTLFCHDVFSMEYIAVRCVLSYK